MKNIMASSRTKFSSAYFYRGSKVIMCTIRLVCGGEPGDEATLNVCNIQYYTNIIVVMSMQHCNYYITNLH